MQLPALIPGSLIRRDNRFGATVLADGALRAVHVASPGRMAELLTTGRAVWLAPFGPRPPSAPPRKTDYRLTLVEHNGGLVSVDTQLPNRLFEEAVRTGVLLPEYATLAREVRWGRSRLDFRLEGPPGVLWVEVKSVTLLEGAMALFPDAPTVRGARHLDELAALARSGQGAMVAFLVQRNDARCFAPNGAQDPAFAAALSRAMAAGVRCGSMPAT